MSVVAKERADRPVTAAALAQAVERGRKRHTLNARSVKYFPQLKSLLVQFADGAGLMLPVANDPELAALSARDLARIEIGFAGNALCLEDHDLHVSIAGLIASSQPLLEVATTVVASRNGQQRSASKAETARRNGQKGGRPRKVAGPIQPNPVSS